MGTVSEDFKYFDRIVTEIFTLFHSLKHIFELLKNDISIDRAFSWLFIDNEKQYSS